MNVSVSILCPQVTILGHQQTQFWQQRKRVFFLVPLAIMVCNVINVITYKKLIVHQMTSFKMADLEKSRGTTIKQHTHIYIYTYIYIYIYIYIYTCVREESRGRYRWFPFPFPIVICQRTITLNNKLFINHDYVKRCLHDHYVIMTKCHVGYWVPGATINVACVNTNIPETVTDHWNPFHKGLMSSKLKSCQNNIRIDYDSNYRIRSQFSTCHDSSAAVTWAKL